MVVVYLDIPCCVSLVPLKKGDERKQIKQIFQKEVRGKETEKQANKKKRLQKSNDSGFSIAVK